MTYPHWNGIPEPICSKAWGTQTSKTAGPGIDASLGVYTPYLPCRDGQLGKPSQREYSRYC